MSIALADPSLVINNEPVAVVPNSVKYTEGDGEQTMRAASTGGGGVQQVYSKNVETNFSKVMFEVFNDIDTIGDLRTWKKNSNQNVVVLTGTTPDGKKLRRTFNMAAMLNDYEVALGSDTTIPVEFSSNASV